jgi:hypothetical protein
MSLYFLKFSASNYFRRIVDDYRYGRVSMLKGILGFEHTWPKYEGLLEVIPFGEMSNVDPNPLAGRNGIVYRAEWICPQKIHMASPKFGRFPCPAVPLHSCGLTGTGLQGFYSQKGPESPTLLNKRTLGVVRYALFATVMP